MDVLLDTAAGSLLRHAPAFPPVTADHLQLPLVQAALDRSAHSRVLLFCAPAGFGKSSALTELAARREAIGEHVAWLTLSDADDAPGVFCRRLVEALAPALPAQGAQALAYLREAGEVPVIALMESLLIDLAAAEQPLLLVLDDLQRISQPALFAGLNRLVQFAPPGLTLALGSRTQPPLNLATWRGKGLLLEVGVEELRLSAEQTRQCLQAEGLQLPDSLLDAVHAQAEGWVMGVHLLARWLREHPVEAERLQGEQAVEHYLLREVFEGLPEEIRQVLLSLAIAGRISGELAGALTGRQDGQALLERLDCLGLFLVPLDRERQWYRFHRLFADFLAAHLRAADPERFTQLHFNASLWFTNHHMPTLAIEHARHAEDPEMLATLVDGYGLELINRGQLYLIARWRREVPDDIAARYPMLVLSDVWSRATDLGLPEANRLVDELLGRWADGRSAAGQGNQYLSALAVKAVLALQKDDLEQCIALARRVESQLGQHSAFLECAILLVASFAHVMQGHAEPARRLMGLAQQRAHFLDGRYLHMQLATIEMVLALEQGQVEQARLLVARLKQQVVPLFDQRSHALALPAIAESLTAYYRLELDGLEERLRWALARVDVINPIDLCAQGMQCLARIQRLQGRGKEALATLGIMQALASRNHSWRIYAMAVGEEINLILQEPAADRCKRAEQRLNALDWQKLAENYRQAHFNPVLWVRGISRVRLLQARGHFSEALHELNQLRGLLQEGWHGLQRLRLDLLSALSYQRLGYQERANSLLGQCLIGAEREGVRSLFIEEGEGIRLLLQQLASTERQPALQVFIRELLNLWPGQEARGATDVLEEDLTDREREVVCLAAQGLSNEEIGQRLSLALGTVKWHLHNIYEKLKVRNRTQAIRRARELSLL